MGLKFKKSFGPKGFKINVGKKGISSASLKSAPGVTINSKRGTTIGIPGTGLSYNTGGGKAKKKQSSNVSSSKRDVSTSSAGMSLKAVKQKEYNRKFKEFTGGYNKKAIIAIIFSFLLCVTPLWPIGLILSMPLLAWLAIDTIVKIIKFKKYIKKH